MLLCAKAYDPAFWQSVPERKSCEKILGVMKKWWQEDCEKPLAQLRYADFRLFFETGDRVTYEAAYFSRRHALNASALLSLVYPEEERYFDKLQEVLFAVCSEYSWCLPAHLRPKSLEDHDRNRVDLFAAETASSLAEISVLLKDRLDPFLLRLIKTEVDRRVVSHFEQFPETWEKTHSNWAAVCTGSVGCAVMHLFPERMEKLLPRFDAAMENFLSGFSEEGICMEGVGYWNYGFGYFTVYADMLRTFTGGQRDYFLRQDVKKVASFFQKVFLSENATVPFSDATGFAKRLRMGLLSYLAGEFPEDVRIYRPKQIEAGDDCARWCLDLREFIWADEDPAWDESAPMEFFAPHAGWYLKRGEYYGFCAKGGCNKEQHNHNDVGAFAFLKNGKQIVCDPGCGEYTRQYFEQETRYDHVECSSRGHSVPIVGGKFQKFGEEFAAKDMTYENGVLSLDIAGAYGEEAIRSIRRSFTFAETSVTLTDTVDCDGEVVERIASFDQPQLCGNTVIIGEGRLTFDESQATVKISSEPNNMNGNPIWFTDFVLTGKEFTLTMQ